MSASRDRLSITRTPERRTTMPAPEIVDTFAPPHYVRAAFSLSPNTLERVLQENDVRVGRTPGGDRRISVLDVRRALGLPVPDYYAPPMS